MILTHRTTPEAWTKIQAEGILWGTPKHPLTTVDHQTLTTITHHRYTWLSNNDPIRYRGLGPILLKVDITNINHNDIKINGYTGPSSIVGTLLIMVPIPITKITC